MIMRFRQKSNQYSIFSSQ